MFGRSPCWYVLAPWAAGLHLALDQDSQQRLVAAVGDDALVVAMVRELEMTAAADDYPTDKAWDALHRCLTNGHPGLENGSYPLNAVIPGGEQLHDGNEYIVSYLTAVQVRDVAD